MERATGVLGLFVMIGVCWLLSANRRKQDLRLIVSGVLLQFGLAALILKTGPGLQFFQGAEAVVKKLVQFSDEGAAFVFGGGPNADSFKEHFIAFSVLPTIVFVSSLTAVLFHVGLLQLIVKAMARIMVWVMDTSGSESLAAAANVFIGQTEAPLVVRPYLETMTRSELMALMTGGMATIAGGVMAAYVGMGASAGHLLAASIMSAPAALVCAKIMVPETEESVTKGVVKIEIPRQDANILDAACRGASDGLFLALNVGAMLIAFMALVPMFNWLLGGAQFWAVAVFAGKSGAAEVVTQPVTFEKLVGWLSAPLAWVMGVEWKDAIRVGQLLGERVIMNEFVAYLHLTSADFKEALSPRSFTIATYALCGFANFGSIAIQIGGIGGLVPRRRKEFAALAFKAMLAGMLASYMTATIAGILI